MISLVWNLLNKIQNGAIFSQMGGWIMCLSHWILMEFNCMCFSEHFPPFLPCSESYSAAARAPVRMRWKSLERFIIVRRPANDTVTRTRR